MTPTPLCERRRCAARVNVILIGVGALLLLAALFVGGCGMSTGGGNSSAATAVQPVGPAAPPATSTQDTQSRGAVQPAAQVSVFLRAGASDFEALSLAWAKVSLLRSQGEPAALKVEAQPQLKPNALALIASGSAPLGEYDGVALQPTQGGGRQWIRFSADGPATPLRLPDRIALKFDAIKLTADGHPLLVISLDLAGLTAKDELKVTSRRFHAGPLPQDQAGELKGQVAPSAALARVCACWAKAGAPVAMTQADAFTGEYALPGLPPGAYYVRVTAAGYQSYQGLDQPVAVTAGRVAQVPPVVLLPAQGFGGR
jgi:hypothetical protein